MGLNVAGFENSNVFIEMCFDGFEKFKQNYSALFMNNGLFVQVCNNLSFSNINESSTPQTYEDVDSIRHNAPDYFRMR